MKPNEDGSIPAISMKAVNFLLLPGQPIKISGSLDEYKLEEVPFMMIIMKCWRTVKHIVIK